MPSAYHPSLESRKIKIRILTSTKSILMLTIRIYFTMQSQQATLLCNYLQSAPYSFAMVRYAMLSVLLFYLYTLPHTVLTTVADGS